MSTAVTKRELKTVSTASQFRHQTTVIAHELLKDWVGEDKAKQATGRIAVAISAAAAAAKDSSEFYRCTPHSVATCIAISALTEVMPSTGAAALAYLIPQPPRKDEPPILQYMLSHRGLNALARRCGQQMITVPISYTDEVKVDELGMFQVVSRDIDNPPTTEKELRGVLLLVRELESGSINTTAFVPKKLIEQRRAMSRSAKSPYSPWSNWYVEMAMKTAMHYAIGRGWCVIDDTASVRALKADSEADLLPADDAGLLHAAPTRGTVGVCRKLGIETHDAPEVIVPQAAVQPVPVEAKAEVTSEAIAVEQSITQRLDSTTSLKKLRDLKEDILAAKLPEDRRANLLFVVDERIAIVQEEAT